MNRKERRTIKHAPHVRDAALKGLQVREFLIKRDAINAEARTVEIAFSSEEPVERYFGFEILDHAASSIRLGRLRDGGAVLMDHDMTDQVGVVESVTVSPDRVGRAVVRFGKSARASEVFQDIIDGIRSKISVGYMIHNAQLDGEKDGIKSYRVIDWEPYEISVVSVPADATVGVGRAAPDFIKPPIEAPKMTIEQLRAILKKRGIAFTDADTIETLTRKLEDEPIAQTPVISGGNDNVAAALGKERARVAALNEIGERFAQFGGVELARAAVAAGDSVDALNAKILERTHTKATPDAGIGLNDQEVKDFSFVRLIHAMTNPMDKRAQEAARFEIEASDAAAERESRNGRKVQGRLIPVDVTRGSARAELTRALLQKLGRRDLTVGSPTGGGDLVATDLLAGSFIELLRKRTVLDRLGITTLSGLVGNIAIPRQTGAATAYWVAESGAPTESQQAVDQVSMSPKTMGAYTDFSRKLMLQSSIDVEAMVRGDLIKVMALEADRVGLYGSGVSNQPSGLLLAAGLNTVDFAGSTPTFAEVVGMETAVAADNADIGTLAYATNAIGRGSLKTTEKSAAGTVGNFIWEQGNTVNGERTEISNQIATLSSTDPDFWFGNWADLVMGMWGGLDLIVDPYTFSTSGTTRVVVLQDIDFAVRHAESFCYGNKTIS